MKKSLLMMTLILTVARLTAAQTANIQASAATLATKVAVLDLKASGIDATVAKNLTELITAESAKIPGYKIIAHSEVKDLVNFEVEKQSMGCDDPSCFTELGSALGVDLVVSGSVGKVGETIVVTLKLIDVKKVESKNRVGDTLVGDVAILPDYIRTATYRLFQQPVPPDVNASYEAMRLRLEKEMAERKGGMSAQAEAEKNRAAAELAKAQADQARAETEKLKTQKAINEKPVDPAAGSWQRIAKNVSTGVAVVGILGGGALHVVSFLKANNIQDPKNADDGQTIIDSQGQDSTQADAQSALNFRKYAMFSYGAGAVGVVAAIVFKILEPSVAPESNSVTVAPTANGLVVRF